MVGVWLWIKDSENNQIPPPLEMALICKRWGTLPKAGGWLDQPARLSLQMDYSKQMYDAFMAYEEARKAYIGKSKEWTAWQKKNKEIIELVAKATKAVADG